MTKQDSKLESDLELLEAHVFSVQTICRRVRQRLAGVSTPATRKPKGLSKGVVAKALAKRAKTRLRTAQRFAK